jgi:hypothetical protein
MARLVLQAAFLRRAEEKIFRKYLLFLGLFWMTASGAEPAAGTNLVEFLERYGVKVEQR